MESRPSFVFHPSSFLSSLIPNPQSLILSLLLSAEQMTITLVPPLVQPAVGHGVLDGAVVLVGVRAVGKLAEADVGPQIAVEAGHFFGDHVPKLELPHARRVDHVAAAIQRQQPGGGGRVPAFFVFVADRLHTGRWSEGSMALSSDDLPTPLCPATTLARPADGAAEALDAEAGLRAEEQDFIAHLAVDARQRLAERRIDEVDLVDADDGPDAAFFGGHEHAVDQVRLQPRLGGAGDDQQLIDVGDEDLLAAADLRGRCTRAAARRAR